ncbi:hypothetical protein QCA50_003955 [Cerrena zonata]|uniref:F-box domain-containing protein n=1 Tax=Cerrena zonata TaxID=2478898 RepID=A0AAW0GMM6_9APHY
MTSTSIIDILPPEIMDEIIGYCVDDIHSLRSCSIVCKAWLPASRYNLFQNHAMRLTRRISEEILESFECAAPSLTGYVRCIHASCQIFLQLSQLTVFPSLEALHLRNLDSSTYTPLISCLDSIYPRLKRIQIKGISYNMNWGGMHGFDAVSLLVSSMKNLRELSFEATWNCALSYGSSPIPGPPPSTLTSLELYDLDPHYISQWLLHHRVNSIERLTLDLIARTHNCNLGRYLEFAGPSIKDLTLLDLGGSEALTTYRAGPYTFLTLFTTLRTLRIGKFSTGNFRGEPPMRITPILEILTAKQALERLVLGFDWKGSNTMVSANWYALEQVLARPQFSSLRTLEVCINPAQNLKPARKILRRMLPRYIHLIEVTHWR